MLSPLEEHGSSRVCHEVLAECWNVDTRNSYHEATEMAPGLTRTGLPAVGIEWAAPSTLSSPQKTGRRALS